MKILIIGFTKMKYMPYARFYLDNIDKAHAEIHVLYWNRDLQEEDLSIYGDVVFHEFRFFQEDDVAKATKIIGFSKYRSFARKLLREGRFSLIIVMHTLPGVLLLKEIIGKKRVPYILDYRDSTYEAFAPFKGAVVKLAANSEVTFTSSDGFRRFLPCDKGNIYTVHNIAFEPEVCRLAMDGHHDNMPIRIGFWGFIRHEELNRSIIEAVGQDERFELHYFGREQQIAEKLKEHVRRLELRNVHFHGEYKPEERVEFSKDIDLVHNLYKDGNTLLAMGNKYYDGIMFQIPQLFMVESQMAKMGVHAGIGMACNPFEERFLDDVYQYYTSIDWEKFSYCCSEELERVLEEQKRSVEVLKRTTGSIAE